MNANQNSSVWKTCWPVAGFYVLLAIAPPNTPGATFWTGPNKTWTKSTSTPSDTIVAGKVVLTRGANQVLINSAAGESFAGANSPLDTEWAFGTMENPTTLSYQSMESLRNGNLAGRILNQPMVVHLKNEDIYFSIKFTTWGTFHSGTVSYTRSTPAVATAPTVSIVSPTNGAVFLAPADVTVSANATISGGTVTNVSFFTNNTLCGSVQTSPFNFTASALGAGAYAISAVATAGGISGTSAVVNITVVAPTLVSLTAPVVNNGVFSFNYSADPGSSYAVESSADLSNWSGLATNVASSSSEPFSDNVGNNLSRFYRVRRLPNP